MQKKAKVKSTLAVVAVMFIVVAAAAACSDSSGGIFAPRPVAPQGETEVVGPHEIVPDFRGYPLEELALEFSNLGFTPSLVMLISDEPVNTVLSVERAGQLVPVPSEIRVRVSAGLPDWGPDVHQESESAAQGHQYENIEFGGINWLVLEEKEDKILLLSDLVLFDMAFNDLYVFATWESSTLRSYLNSDFLNSFSPEDRQRIALTRVVNNDTLFTMNGTDWEPWPVPGGNDTDDHVFLLSYDEQRRYFENDTARMARMVEDHPKQDTGYETWWWWLRSPGECNFTARLVLPIGMDFYGNDVNAEVGVRPALWLYKGSK